jgi:hypothetical protein
MEPVENGSLPSKKTGKEYAFSTNSEIYLYNLEAGTTSNLTEGIMGYDLNPVFSPDGSKLAWESMERDGYESDQARLFVYDFKTGERANLFEGFEESAHSICWSANSDSIWFISDIKATDEIFTIEVGSRKITRLTDGTHNYKTVQLAGRKLLARKHSMSRPDELFLVDPVSGSDRAITRVNDQVFNNIKIGKVEKRWVKTTDTKYMLVWVILPPDFDPNKKYPALLYCQGGPQGTVSQFWSYRWNFQIMAANDYIVVAPNRRGLPALAWNGLNRSAKIMAVKTYRTTFSAIDDVAKDLMLTKTTGQLGKLRWVLGVLFGRPPNKRFKAFVSHCGIFNLTDYLTTEEMWFVDWITAAPSGTRQIKPPRSYTFLAPIFMSKTGYAILVIHGGKDSGSHMPGYGSLHAAIMREFGPVYLSRRKPLGLKTTKWDTLAKNVLSLVGSMAKNGGSQYLIGYSVSLIFSYFLA